MEETWALADYLRVVDEEPHRFKVAEGGRYYGCGLKKTHYLCGRDVVPHIL